MSIEHNSAMELQSLSGQGERAVPTGGKVAVAGRNAASIVTLDGAGTMPAYVVATPNV